MLFKKKDGINRMIPFDEVIEVHWDDIPRDLVIHRNPQGEVFAWHSPLDAGAVRCSICESGARVYIPLSGEIT